MAELSLTLSEIDSDSNCFRVLLLSDRSIASIPCLQMIQDKTDFKLLNKKSIAVEDVIPMAKLYDLLFIDIAIQTVYEDIKILKQINASAPLLPIVALTHNDDTEFRLLISTSGAVSIVNPNLAPQMVFQTAQSLSTYGGAARLLEIQNSELVQALEEIKKIQQEKDIAHKALLSSAKLASLGEISSNIAHEINNPLTVILGTAANIKRILKGTTIEERDKLIQYIDKIHLVSERIASIVRGLKSFSRSSEDDPLEPVELSILLRDTLAFCLPAFKEVRVSLTVEPFPNDWQIRCCHSQISQVLVNLLVNAKDAVEHQPEKWVKVRVQELSADYVISIEDSGAGILKAIETRVFEPFFTTKPVGKGTGLGLSISSRIIQDHQGSLRIDRSTSVSTLIVTLPKYKV